MVESRDNQSEQFQELEEELQKLLLDLEREQKMTSLEVRIKFYKFIKSLEKVSLRKTIQHMYVPSDLSRGNCPDHQAERLYFLDSNLNIYGYFDHFFLRLIHPKVLARHHIQLKYNPDADVFNQYEIWKNGNLIYSDKGLLQSDVMKHAFPKRWELFEQKYFKYRILISRIKKKIQN